VASSTGLPLPAVVVAVVAASAIGCVLGFAARYLTETPEPVKLEPQIIQQQLSADELAKLCEPEFKDERQTLIDAQAKVKSLESELDAKNKELVQLKADAEKNSANREEAIKRWRAKEKEISDLKTELETAKKDRDDYMVQLQTTIRQLNTEIAARKEAEAKADYFQNESTEASWGGFISNAKVEICDRGTKKRHEKCHEAVDASMTPAIKEKFATCVNSYQAVPVLKQLEKKETLPTFAESLPDDNKFTNKGWYILFCDPTLPESGARPWQGAGPAVDADGTLQTTTPDLQDPGEAGTTTPTSTTPTTTTPTTTGTGTDAGTTDDASKMRSPSD